MRMRGGRRSSSFRKEKPAGLSRALSWLNVSTLSRQSRRIFHSQNELHAVHHRQTHSYSHTHLHAADKDERDDDDNWVYQPQHKIGERRKEKDEDENEETDLCLCVLILFVVCLSIDARRPNHGLPWPSSQLVTMLRVHLNGFLFSLSTRKPVNDLFTCTSKARSGSLSFYGLLFSVSTSLALPGC